MPQTAPRVVCDLSVFCIWFLCHCCVFSICFCEPAVCSVFSVSVVCFFVRFAHGLRIIFCIFHYLFSELVVCCSTFVSCVVCVLCMICASLLCIFQYMFMNLLWTCVFFEWYFHYFFVNLLCVFLHFLCVFCVCFVYGLCIVFVCFQCFSL